jgi:chitinase
MPLYGRSFANTQGPGSSFSGTGQGTWESGVYDYRVLPLPSSTVHFDNNTAGSWTYDASKREMISFDNEDAAKVKGAYIRKEGLAGSMFWELSGDKGYSRDGMEGGPGKVAQPGHSLVTVVKDTMGGLETSTNWLSYSESKFDNMRKGMS